MTNSKEKSQDVREVHSEQTDHAQEAGSQVDDCRQEVAAKVTSNLVELAPDEIGSISEAVNMLTEIINSHASQYIERIERALQGEGITFDELMELVATQKNANGDVYGDPYSRKFLHFAGGLREHVFTNLMFKFSIMGLDRFSVDYPKPNRIVAAVALKKAMREDAKLKKLVEAVASATKIVGQEGEFEPFKIAIGRKN